MQTKINNDNKFKFKKKRMKTDIENSIVKMTTLKFRNSGSLHGINFALCIKYGQLIFSFQIGIIIFNFKIESKTYLQCIVNPYDIFVVFCYFWSIYV